MLRASSARVVGKDFKTLGGLLILWSRVRHLRGEKEKSVRRSEETRSRENEGVGVSRLAFRVMQGTGRTTRSKGIVPVGSH